MADVMGQAGMQLEIVSMSGKHLITVEAAVLSTCMEVKMKLQEELGFPWATCRLVRDRTLLGDDTKMHPESCLPDEPSTAVVLFLVREGTMQAAERYALLLADRSSEARRAACLAFLCFGPVATQCHLQALLTCFGDEDEDVRHSAYLAAKQLDFTVSSNRDAVKKALRATRNFSGGRRQAEARLAHILFIEASLYRGEELGQLLCNAWAQEQPLQCFEHHASLETLVMAAASSVAAHMRDSSCEVVRAYACRLLQEFGPAVLQHYADQLVTCAVNDADSAVRWYACKALSKLEGEAVSPLVVKCLVKCGLNGDSAHICQAACDALLKIKPSFAFILQQSREAMRTAFRAWSTVTPELRGINAFRASQRVQLECVVWCSDIASHELRIVLHRWVRGTLQSKAKNWYIQRMLETFVMHRGWRLARLLLAAWAHRAGVCHRNLDLWSRCLQCSRRVEEGDRRRASNSRKQRSCTGTQHECSSSYSSIMESYCESYYCDSDFGDYEIQLTIQDMCDALDWHPNIDFIYDDGIHDGIYDEVDDYWAQRLQCAAARKHEVQDRRREERSIYAQAKCTGQAQKQRRRCIKHSSLKWAS